MRRTTLVWAPPAALVALAWLRLEQPVGGTARIVAVLLLALAPALPRRPVVRAAIAGGAIIAGAAVAAGVSPLAVRPTHFVTTIAARADEGLRAFYSLALPFDPHAHPEMHALALFAIFVFALVLGLTIAAGRPVGACLVLVAGAAWPTTLVGGAGTLVRGGLLLVACLFVLAALRPGTSLVRPALAAGAVLVLGSLAASVAPAVARGGVVDWQRWNPYAQDRQVSVAYVWRSQYRGIRFPRHPTAVFEVAAPDLPRYWRATTLDTFDHDVWDEALTVTIAVPLHGREVLTADATLPAKANDPSRWLRQRVTIRALADDHLPAATTPVAYDSGQASQLYDGGVALRFGGLQPNDSYTVWSYAPRPQPRALARLGVDYPQTGVFSHYLGVWGDEGVPAFGTPRREAAVDRLFRSDPAVRRYEPLYRIARRVVGRARTPYAAAVALETWFRSAGEFVYDEQPPQARGVPPLVDFVTRTHAGYCQHFAGAMALMLRYLGVPARVAAGFTSGRWDGGRRRWIVSDTDAHAWVEVWFPGYGWLPFDPTPSRGSFDAPYSDASASFDPGAAATALGGLGGGLGLKALQRLAREARRGNVLPPGGAITPAPSVSRAPGIPHLVLVGSVAGAVVAALALLALAKWVRRRLRYGRGDPRRVAAACRREFEELAADQGVRVPQGATGAEAAALVAERLGVDARALARAVAEARFGPPGRATTAAVNARRELAAFRRALRDELTVRSRVRGLVSLRSLRAA